MTAADPLPTETKPRHAICVLPFANISGDPEQEYFADGMSEDLITELAHIPGLFVIGRGTSFAYKGKSVAAREIGRELGVRHVVEGSVRRAGARVRIALPGPMASSPMHCGGCQPWALRRAAAAASARHGS